MTAGASAPSCSTPHSLIAARRLDRDPVAAIDAAWIRARLEAAVALRARVTGSPYHRLVHAEADGLPGLIVDRFGDVAVLQANTAGMDRLLPEMVAGLLVCCPCAPSSPAMIAPAARMRACPRT